jgi:hypothetical protein
MPYHNHQCVKSSITLCPLPAHPKQGISFGGNLHVPGSEVTTAFRNAQRVKYDTTRMQGQRMFINKTLNVYGTYAGAPGGSKGPPRNTFI